MKAILSRLGALIVVAAMATSVRADAPYYYASYPYLNIPQAPDACGPGYYNVGPCGMVYGPNYCVYPCFPPWQGAVFGPKLNMGPNGQPYVMGPQGPAPLSALPGLIQGPGPGAPPPRFVNHPFARSPRDFFMNYD